MATFKVTGPDGNTYQVTAPDDASEQDLIGYVQNNYQSVGQSQAPLNPLGRVGAAAEGFAQGMFTPWVDEFVTDPIAAGLSSAILTAQGNPTSPIDLYKDARGITEARQAENFDKYPATSIASGVAGGVAGAGLLGGTGLGKAIDGALRPVAQRGLLQAGEKALRAGGVGAAMGAVESAGVGSGIDERLDNAQTGLLMGGVLGAGASGIGSAIGSASRAVDNAVTPQIDEYTAELAQKAKDMGIRLPMDVLSEDETLKTVGKTAQAIPFSGIKKIEKQNLSIWEKQVAKTIGVDKSINAKTLGQAKERFGGLFDAIETGRNVEISPQFIAKLAEVENIYANAATNDIGEKVLAQVNRVNKEIGDGGIVPVETLARLRKDLGAMADKAPNHEIAHGLMDIQSTLSDEIIDSLPNVGKEQYRQLKNEYRNFIAVKKAVKLDPQAALNSPAKLLNAVASVYKDFPTGGGGELGDLARIGKLFVSQRHPGSNTFDKLVTGGMTLGGLGLGAASALNVANPMLLAALPATSVIARGAKNALYSDKAAQRAIDAALGKGSSPMLPANVLQQLNQSMSKPIPSLLRVR